MECVANYTGGGTYSKAIAVTHHPEWATCGYFISWARWFIARPVIFHPRTWWNEVIDRGREGTPSNREFLFITIRAKEHQSDRTIYVFAYCTLDFIHWYRYSVCWRGFGIRKSGNFCNDLEVCWWVESIIWREFDRREDSNLVSGFIIFLLPFWKFYQLESEVDANMIFAYVGGNNGKIMETSMERLLYLDWRNLKMYILM